MTIESKEHNAFSSLLRTPLYVTCEKSGVGLKHFPPAGLSNHRVAVLDQKLHADILQLAGAVPVRDHQHVQHRVYVGFFAQNLLTVFLQLQQTEIGKQSKLRKGVYS